jgi:hypothetical protein
MEMSEQDGYLVSAAVRDGEVINIVIDETDWAAADRATGSGEEVQQ